MGTTQYDRTRDRLVMFNKAATAEFWDSLWQSDNLRKQIELESANSFYVAQTQRVLPANPDTRVLDAGCGRGAVVLSHARAGYDAYGIDFAAQTIDAARQLYPELKLSVADVRQLPFEDNFFSAYWSLGVIEHFYDGYQEVIVEARRVIKPGGFLLITFPHLSGLRKLKISLRAYEQFDSPASAPINFYQFALNYRKVLHELQQLGFELRYRRSLDGLKGLNDEVAALRPLIKTILHSRSRLIQMSGAALSEAFAPVAGHIVLLVLQLDKSAASADV